MAHTACLVCVISTVAAAKKAMENALGRCGANSRHITKLEQFIFFRYLCICITLPKVAKASNEGYITGVIVLNFANVNSAYYIDICGL
jgi:hypothetical protein